MNTAQRAIYGIMFAVVSILVALIISLAIPAMDAHSTTVYTVHTHGQSHRTLDPVTTAPNISMPMLSEDRYVAGSQQGLIELITDIIIPSMLPRTSGQCGEDSGIDC